MNRAFLLLYLLFVIPTAYGWESPATETAAQVSFPFDLAIIDPDAKEKRPP